MKKVWNYFTDKFGLTVFHPQYFINKYNKYAVDQIKSMSLSKDIVDLGCGRMQFKSYLLETSKSYFGIDHPGESKRYISNNKPDLLTYFNRINLPNNKFDTASMMEVLEYLEKPAGPEVVLSEIHRILKKGGKIILTSPFMYPIHDGKIDKNRFTPQKIHDLLSETKFKKIKVVQQGNFFVFITNSVLVYVFKAINQSKSYFKIMLIPFGLLLSTLMNIATIPFEKIKNDDFPINIFAIAEK